MPKKYGNVHMFDGVKSTPLSSWEHYPGGDALSDSITSLYRSVPTLYAAIHSRMEAIAATPWELYRVEDSHNKDTEPVTERYPELSATIDKLLPRTEGAICLYGRAYWLVDNNRMRTRPTPRWALPGSITPRYDNRDGLVGFDRSHSTGSVYFPLEGGIAPGLIYFWLDSLTEEERYDVAPAHVAMRAARASGAMTEFIDRFFARGAVRQTLLMVPEDSDASEVEALRSWWHRVFRGSKTANQAEVLRSNVEATTIGDGVQDLSNEQLEQMLRRHISKAFRVPESILVASASNYAVSNQDWLTFWEICIKPEFKRIRNIINEQLLRPLGIYLWEETGRLEFYQAAELEKAERVGILVERGIWTEDEARDILEYEPLPEDERRIRQMARKFSAMEQALRAGLSAEQAAQLLGIDLPQDPSDVVARETEAMRSWKSAYAAAWEDYP